jgi:hypothetical protein
MPDFTTLHWIAAAVAALIVGLAKTGVPGIGILAVILMASAMPAKLSVGFILPLLVTGDVFAVSYYRRHADWRQLLRLIPAALVGIVIGWILLRTVFGDDGASARLRPVIGGIVLVLLLLDLWWKRYAGPDAIPNHRAVAAAVGAVAGTVTMLANAAGSLIALYFIAMRFDKHQFIGTAAWYFLLLNCVKIPFFVSEDMITGDSLRAGLLIVPAVVAGALLGVRVLKRIPQAWFIRVVRVLTVVGSIWLIVGETVKGWLQGGS